MTQVASPHDMAFFSDPASRAYSRSPSIRSVTHAHSRSSSVNSAEFEEILRRVSSGEIEPLFDMDHTGSVLSDGEEEAAAAIAAIGDGIDDVKMEEVDAPHGPFVACGMPAMSPTPSELQESIGSSESKPVMEDDVDMANPNEEAEEAEADELAPPYAEAVAFAMPWIPGFSAKGTRVKKTEFLQTSKAYALGATMAELIRDGIDESDIRAHARAGLIRFVDTRVDDPGEIRLMESMVEACRGPDGAYDKDAMAELTLENVERNARFVTVKAKKTSKSKDKSNHAAVSMAFLRKVLSALKTSATAEARDALLAHVNGIVSAKISEDEEILGGGSALPLTRRPFFTRRDP